MAEERKYYIRVPHALVEVTREVYLAYYQARRSARTLVEKDRRHGIVSFDDLDAISQIPDWDTTSVEDAAIANVLRDKLHHCLDKLPPSERELLFALYFEGLSERKYAESLGISQKAVNKRRHQVLAKLRSMIKI